MQPQHPATATLLHIASILEDQQNHCEAIKCLVAALTSQEAPQVEVAIRVRLATLLIRHTHNLTEARQHLERAVRLDAAC